MIQDSTTRTTAGTSTVEQRLAMFSAMRYPNYRLYWIGQLASILGQNMQYVARSWLVLQLTNSPLMLGLVGLCNAVPSIGFTLVGGAVADRANRWVACSSRNWDRRCSTFCWPLWS